MRILMDPEELKRRVQEWERQDDLANRADNRADWQQFRRNADGMAASILKDLAATINSDKGATKPTPTGGADHPLALARINRASKSAAWREDGWQS